MLQTIAPALASILVSVYSLAVFGNEFGPCHEFPLVNDEPSVVGISILEGSQVNLWSRRMRPREDGSFELQLQPDRPAVIGRADGTRPPYLAEGYTTTPMVPQGGSVLKGGAADGGLSRAHFMLKHHPDGIAIVNGVPAVDGGIRPPTNGTQLLLPENRPMGPGEEFLVTRGSSAKILLPNGTVLLIGAQ